MGGVWQFDTPESFLLELEQAAHRRVLPFFVLLRLHDPNQLCAGSLAVDNMKIPNPWNMHITILLCASSW